MYVEKNMQTFPQIFWNFCRKKLISSKMKHLFTMHYFQIVQLLFIQILSINLTHWLHPILLLSLWFVLLFISIHIREYITSAYMQSISLLIHYPQCQKSIYQDSYLDDLFSKHSFITRSFECTCSYQFLVAHICHSATWRKNLVTRLVQFRWAEKWWGIAWCLSTCNPARVECHDKIPSRDGRQAENHYATWFKISCH